MISAQRIEWNNLDSLEFDLITCLSFDSDSGDSPSFLNQDGIYTEHYDGHRTVHRAKKNEFFNPTFTFIKDGFGDFTIDEQRKILSWLSTETPGWLNVYHDDSNVLSYRCFGTWESIELYKLGNGRVVGYVVSFASTHAHAWSRKFIYPEVHATTKEISNNDESNDYLQVVRDKTFTITCNTDEYNKPLYPKVTIIFKGKNAYFPIDVNPLEEKTYPMVPNVIYSWTEYTKATQYVSGVKYYSDTKGTVAVVQPTNDSQITSGIYYIGTEHLYVNLNGTEHNGKYAIQALNSSDINQSNPPMEYEYYYLPDGYIKKLVKDNKNNWTWEPVVLVGMAVRIKNTYLLNGASVTKEAIITGGTMDEVVILDGTNKIVSGTKGATTRIIGDDFNWEWIPFVYGENNITVMGNCYIKFEWLEPRKVGSL
jgi:hypothetical protein